MTFLVLWITIACNIRSVVGEDCNVVGDNVVGAVHEAKVGAAVEHVEVDAAIKTKNVAQNFTKFWKKLNKVKS